MLSVQILLLSGSFARLPCQLLDSEPCLSKYGIMVDLQPGKVIVFDANIVHYIRPHPGYPGLPFHHWAISCFFQQQVLNMHHLHEAYP